MRTGDWDYEGMVRKGMDGMGFISMVEKRFREIRMKHIKNAL
jgi:hypothetical protein